MILSAFDFLDVKSTNEVGKLIDLLWHRRIWECAWAEFSHFEKCGLIAGACHVAEGLQEVGVAGWTSAEHTLRLSHLSYETVHLVIVAAGRRISVC